MQIFNKYKININININVKIPVVVGNVLNKELAIVCN